MTKALLFDNTTQFADNSGRPLNGGLLTITASGGSTAIQLYRDFLGTLNHTAPTITLSSEGQCEVWVDEGQACRISLTDSAGNSICSAVDGCYGKHSGMVTFPNNSVPTTALATQTANRLLCYDNSGNPAVGTVTTPLTLASNTLNISSSALVGGWHKLDTSTVSGQYYTMPGATLQTSVYNMYKVELRNINLSSSSASVTLDYSTDNQGSWTTGNSTNSFTHYTNGVTVPIATNETVTITANNATMCNGLTLNTTTPSSSNFSPEDTSLVLYFHTIPGALGTVQLVDASYKLIGRKSGDTVICNEGGIAITTTVNFTDLRVNLGATATANAYLKACNA